MQKTYKPRTKRPIADRFWEKVQKSDGCWTWTGSRYHNGYGYLHFGTRTERKPLRAHRVSWELHNGDILDGLWVLHRCDNPSCVRPDHLFLGDRKANMEDCSRKGRTCKIGYSRRTHCAQGHAFTPENTRLTKVGHRKCKECERLYKLRYREENGERINAERRRIAAAIRARKEKK